ncbi:MAG: DUF1822 family protein [Leptolyngbyaceae cyanobacterium CSU_1_4]|nr:DUF1822 family protein [Leptolyngbyaceae cyanobacterium CSU_1_4]
MTLLFDSSTHCLEISDNVQITAWQQSETVRIPGNRWQVYLNQICLETVLPWLQEKFSNQVTPVLPIAQPAFWDLVNGFALTLGETRLVLIPSDAIDRLEFRVPQEWIDIPSWVADYYLAIEVDLDEQWINIWGYTTHQVLKASENYDVGDRAYWLEGSTLITDLNVLWVMHHLATEPTRAPVTALSQVPIDEAERWLDRLGTAMLPRLELPFVEWGALMQQDNWRQQLYERRQPINLSLAANLNPPAISPFTTLSRWLQNEFETGWQAIESLMGSSPELAFGLREEATSGAIARRVKQIVIRAPEQIHTVLLLLLLTTEAEGRLAVRVRLLPNGGETLLPPHLELSLLSAESAEILQSVQTRSQDNSIQLRRFRCTVGTQFRLQIALGTAIVVEDFVV